MKKAVTSGRKVRSRGACPCTQSRAGGCRKTVFLVAGMECPHCHFARLGQTEPGELRCPICGYGTHRPVT